MPGRDRAARVRAERAVKKGEVTTWKRLLEPKWQGKMIAKDPATGGSGASLISYLYLTFGPDFVRKLYQDQTEERGAAFGKVRELLGL